MLIHLHGLHGPSFLQITLPVAWPPPAVSSSASGKRSPSKSTDKRRRWYLGNCIGLLHSSNRGIFIVGGDDVACGQMLEVDDVVRRDDAESLLDTKVESTLETLGHPTAQGPQATGHRAPRCAALPLVFLARGHGGSLQVFEILLR